MEKTSPGQPEGRYGLLQLHGRLHRVFQGARCLVEQQVFCLFRGLGVVCFFLPGPDGIQRVENLGHAFFIPVIPFHFLEHIFVGIHDAVDLFYIVGGMPAGNAVEQVL
jgi:hypothetical protein